MTSTFVSDLFLQGMYSVELQTEELILSWFPSTIVDLENGKVFQTEKYHDHIYLSQNLRKLQTYNTLKDNAPELFKNPKILFEHIWQSNKPKLNQVLDSIHEVKKDTKFVKKFLLKLNKLPTSLRSNYINHWVDYIYSKAFTLAQMVKTKSINNENKKLTDKTINKIKKNLDIKDEEEFFMILATAEKMKSGIYALFFNDQNLKEQMVQNMFYGDLEFEL
ncbi:guanine nucleotide exchange c9orf72 [Anaeramoeba flamelloides]|uniref:Guanine nucleotide exchange c9orf72 n=1 Tax=Anaeramoeba flamelloides TaxID=1746091 RepID=A0ABQ8YR06_9EUKA|nr:guanine nucleotide exchange c9orf72 [Anaeramoeba flamelloides]